MAAWQVQINGRASDLDHLARHLTTADSRVIRDATDGGFLYESAAFAACTDSHEVLSIANSHLAVLSGILNVTRSSDQSLGSGAVLRSHADGRRDVFVAILATAQARIEVGDVTAVTTDASGTVVTLPARSTRTVTLAALAHRDEAVAKAMRLIAAVDFKSWVGLYRVHEVIEADVGSEHALKRRAWGSAVDMKRFKHSANSVAVAGDAARHGREADTPPRRPMTLDEAVAYVTYLVQAWLASKEA
jgi:hypothetical protein